MVCGFQVGGCRHFSVMNSPIVQWDTSTLPHHTVLRDEHTTVIDTDLSATLLANIITIYET